MTEFGATTYTWRADISRLVRRFERRYQTKANTYEDHPTGWGLDRVSVDFWSLGGRGAAIARDTGHAIFQHLFRRRSKPYFRWIIWRGTVYYPSGYTEPYSDPQDQHYDHVHVTFW